MRVLLEKVPLGVRRRAAHRLESVRGTALGPKADTVRLGPEACPMYRPDVRGVAYYEFDLLDWSAAPAQFVTARATAMHTFDKDPKTRAAAARPSEVGPGRGFLIASAGPHDFPIPHWSLEGLPPSRILEQLAAGQKEKVARVVKLDALSYVGENEQGQRIATLGELPMLVDGLPHDLRKQRRGISSLIARPPGSGREEQPKGDHRIERSGPKPPKLKVVEPSSWKDLKSRYAEAFGPFLADLQRRADEAWQVDRLVEEFGEGIMVGDTHTVALLQDRAKIDVHGEALGSVEIRLVERRPGQTVAEIHAISLPSTPRADLELAITYAGGETEKLRFFVVSRDVPSNPRAGRPPETEEAE